MKLKKLFGFLFIINIFLLIFVVKIFAANFTITSVSPDNGTTTGGTNLVINGAGFFEEISFTQLSQGGSFALASNGKLYAWGNNYNGQLGNNSTAHSSVPVEVDMSGALAGKTITAIAAGSNHTLVLTSEGQVYAWGYNYFGQLGNDSTTNSSIPVAVDTSGALAGKTITAIAGNYNHSLALDTEGQVYAWGGNGRGQLGNDSTTNSSIPVAVDVSGALAGKTITAIAAGLQFSSVLSSEGKLYSWGENSAGQLGNNSISGLSLIPVITDNTEVLIDKTIISIRSGSEHTLVLTSEGQVYAWGQNSSAQLGNNSTTSSSVPVAVDTSGALAGKTITAIAAGVSHSLVLDAEGKIHTWGNNYSGQLGNGFNEEAILNPATVDTSGVLAGKTITAIVSKFHHSLALDAEGRVYAWGNNNYGQLGNNSTSNSSVPVAVDISGALAGKTITAIAAGARNNWSEDIYSLALDAEGQVYAWGKNNYGQLGNDSTTNSSIPVAVDVSGALAGKTITAIAAGASHSLALDTEGQVYAWGSNSDNQLGNNSTSNSSVPVAVDISGALAGKTITAIAAGASHSLVLDTEGQVYAWGNNSYGQLGNGSNIGSSVPIMVDTSGALAGKIITAIAVNYNHSLVLDTEGQVYAWGNNSYGQLGNGFSANSLVPVTVDTSGVLADKTITAISAGMSQTLALDTEGQVYAWGSNNYGQLGDGSKSNSLIPIMTNMSNVLAGKSISSIVSGASHSLALDTEGQVYAWGSNNYGQTGTYDFSKMFSVKSEKQIVSVGFGLTNFSSLGTNLVVDSADQLAVTTPVHSAGPVDLILTNNFGEQITVVNGYTYQLETIPTPTPTPTFVPITVNNEEQNNQGCVAQKPNSPTLVNVQRLSPTEATVFWSQGNGEVTHWYLVYEKKGGDGNKKIAISNAAAREYKIENLDSAADYTFTVIQANGCSESSSSNAFSLESTEKNVIKPIAKIKTNSTKLKSENGEKNGISDSQAKVEKNSSAINENSKEITTNDLIETKENKNLTKAVKNSTQNQISSFVKKTWAVVTKNVQIFFSTLKNTVWSWFK